PLSRMMSLHVYCSIARSLLSCAEAGLKAIVNCRYETRGFPADVHIDHLQLQRLRRKSPTHRVPPL
ncbi:MAG: hypothetical protein WA196_17340, partial [Pseudolabrys sp.]